MRISRWHIESDAWRTGRVYSDLSLAIDAAVDGEGVILADDILCRQEMASNRLVRLGDGLVRCVWYQVVLPRNAGQKPASETLRNWLLDKTHALRD
ncbi:hypothetical protein [Cognatishimia maritima]|uniref:hypothetical protein n=1 Tax=Cognatishimia maritima TaxID=870908 RepID=UPI0009350EA7|nr:hypothetical protein [Cognatishimia maritima]